MRASGPGTAGFASMCAARIATGRSPKLRAPAPFWHASAAIARMESSRYIRRAAIFPFLPIADNRRRPGGAQVDVRRLPGLGVSSLSWSFWPGSSVVSPSTRTNNTEGRAPCGTRLTFTISLSARLNGAARSCGGPVPYPGLKITQFHRYRRTAFARVPAPEHQRRRHVLDDLLDAAMSVLLRILEQLAELAVR